MGRPALEINAKILFSGLWRALQGNLEGTQDSAPQARVADLEDPPDQTPRERCVSRPVGCDLFESCAPRRITGPLRRDPGDRRGNCLADTALDNRRNRELSQGWYAGKGTLDRQGTRPLCMPLIGARKAETEAGVLDLIGQGPVHRRPTRPAPPRLSGAAPDEYSSKRLANKWDSQITGRPNRGTLPRMRLADLHRHLDGSLRNSTFRELAAACNHRAPDDLRFFAGMGLDYALARFKHTLAVLQTPFAVERVAREICEDAAADGVSTLEIRFAPQLHHGAAPAAIVDAALAGIDGRAGLLLCGLYGEDPAVLSDLVEIAASRPGVVGIDLAGSPAKNHRWRLKDYAAPYHRAAKLGLGRTVHAGEGRPPAEIRVAVEILGAQRIGHGTTLLDDPEVTDLVLERGVVIEACPTSNVHVGALAQLRDHPLRRWLQLGIRACICTDNPFFSDVTSSSELRVAREVLDLDDAAIEQALANGHAGAFTRL